VMGLPLPAATGAAITTTEPEPDILSAHALTATLRELPSVAQLVESAAAPPMRRAAMLAAGIQDVTQTMSGDSFRLNEVLRMILETMMRALKLQRVLFCLRDAQGIDLHGRFGLGDRAMAMAPHFHIPLQPGKAAAANLFSAVCLKGADTLIADARAPSIAARLPAWFHAQVQANAFLLLPMLMKGAPFALIYADIAAEGAFALGEQELAMLRTLRNQAVMAFKQTGG